MQSVVDLVQVVDAALTELRKLNLLVGLRSQVLKIFLILLLLIVGCNFHVTID